MKRKSGAIKDVGPYFLGFVVLAGVAMLTVINYVYPDSAVFENTKYHILENEGINFNDSLALVQSDDVNKSLWDHKTGDILLKRVGNHVAFSINDFYEPFYLSKGSPEKLKLQNPILSQDISDGFTIEDRGQLIFELKIIKKPKSGWFSRLKGEPDSCLYLMRTDRNSAKFDTSTFQQKVSKSFPLMAIVDKAVQVKLSEELRFLLEGALLLRTEVQCVDPNSDESIADNKSPLVLFPKSGFFYSRTITMNGKLLDNPHQKFMVFAGNADRFYAGTSTAKTDVLQIDIQEKGTEVGLSYLLPKMYSLNDIDKDNRLFITSSMEEVQYHNLKGGYFFNIFDSVKNVNHINGILHYRVGTPMEKMYFSVKDLYAESNEPVIYPADSIFFLKTKNVQSGVKWRFMFRDLRDTNPLKIRHINYYIILFIILVGLRLYTDKTRIVFRNSKFRFPHEMAHLAKLSFIEIGAYVVVFCFCVFRLILAWRMSTFLPINDIGLIRFGDLSDGYGVYWWTTAMTLAVFVIVLLVNFIFNYRKQQFKEFTPPQWSPNRILLAFGLILLLLIVFTIIFKGRGSRIINIPIPVLTYFLFDFWLISAKKIYPRPTITPKRYPRPYKLVHDNYPGIVLWLTAFLYFAIQDSGFSVIFALYGLIHHLFQRFLFSSSLSKWRALLYISGLCAAFCMFLIWESRVILFAYKYTEGCLLAFTLLSGGLALIIGSCPFFKRKRRLIIVSILVAAGISAPFFSKQVANYLNTKKSYIKYRAEIQVPGMKIDNMIKESGYQSSDMAYILRSAHNQWFINLYNQAKHNSYFELQPHFNQGSTFTTQTTDLVVTRYILAEHPKWILILLMIMLLFLPLIYMLNVGTKQTQINYSILGAFVLIYAIAFFVCLSATNLVVFFGQDFPFLSITSKIAVGFPLLIFLLAIFNSWQKNNFQSERIDALIYNKLWFVFTIVVISVSGYVLLNMSEKSNNSNDFNISKVLERTSGKLDMINSDFGIYQTHHLDSFKGVSMDSVFSRFLKSDTAQNWNKIAGDSLDKFNASLFKAFEKFKNKSDPDNLLHVQKRNGIYKIVVNLQYYFLKSFKDDSIKWRGNLMAAKTEANIGFVDKYKNKAVLDSVVASKGYQRNVLAELTSSTVYQTYKSQLNNVFITKLDSSWTNNGEPVYLVKTGGGREANNEASFDIYNDTLSISSKWQKKTNAPLLAIKISKRDLLSFNVKEQSDSKNKTVLQLNLVDNNEKFLAKNLWLNGKRSLFYPLGKEFIWSYNFANLLRQSLDTVKNRKYVDSTIRISIDYDLTKRLYDIIDDANKPKSNFNVRDDIRQKLVMFRNLEDTQLKIQSNGTGMYLLDNKLQPDPFNRNDHELVRVINYINDSYESPTGSTEKKDIRSVIGEVINTNFDYSAVVLDGFGRIRTLFDYNRYAKIDPNNFRDFNRFLSDAYKQDLTGTEQDLLGNKSITVIQPGPGSSFKPIAYTSAASQVNFGWENLSIDQGSIENGTTPSRKRGERDLRYYGGKSLTAGGESLWTVENPSAGVTGHDYLIPSNNLFHSLIVFLGSQNEQTLSAIRFKKDYQLLFKDPNTPGSNNESNFPVIHYDNHLLSIDPDKWLQNGDLQHFGNNNSVLSIGLSENFRLKINVSEYYNQNYDNPYGNDDLFNLLYGRGQKTNYFNWSFPELSTFNQLDRTPRPRIRKGLINPTLGTFPIRVTPLEMATMGMRLATLNRAPSLTSLSTTNSANNYEFFKLGPTWKKTEFIEFYKKTILEQMDQVITSANGTAHLLMPVRKDNPKYFFYAKTGTLNISTDNRREKHLMVIITNKKIDGNDPLTENDLKSLKYYVLYLSYHNIDMDDYSDFNPFIYQNYVTVVNAVTHSDLFKSYMNSKQ